MENRFGFVHVVLSALLILLIVVILLGMKQLDRQWILLQQIQQQGADQTQALTRINRSLQDGVAVSVRTGNQSPTTAAAYPKGDPFGAFKAAEAQPDFSRGDWLIQNLATKVPKITPIVSSDLYGEIVQARVLESLAYRDPTTLQYLPQLARDWQISDDGLTYTFQLRQGVTFSDGEPFTADDVLYSYNIIMDAKIDAARQRAYYEKIKSIKKNGDYEVVFTMSEPYFESFDLCSSLTILPKHFYSKYGQEEINTNPGLLMGTGPYKMRDPAGWRPGQKIELFRNDSYWGEPPTFNRLIYLEVEEEAAEQTMFGNGELDVFQPMPSQYQQMLKEPKTLERSNHYEFASPLNGYFYIAWNQKRKDAPTRYADVRVRTALTMLTDRDRILKDVYLGYGSVISGPFDPTSPQADPSISPVPYDPEGAKKLLATAGYSSHGSDGTLDGPDGQPFKIKLSYASGNATFERVVLMLKDSYAKAGIELDADPVDWPILVKKLDTRDFEAITLGWGGSIESDLYQEFDSSQIADQGDNFMSYSNPKLDAIVREARVTVDDKKRMGLWHQAHHILADDQPYTFLLSRKTLSLVDKRIHNIGPSRLGLNMINLYNMPNPWYVPKAMQKYSQ
jgi:peptide/nickel transport system substrate-binding protein